MECGLLGWICRGTDGSAPLLEEEEYCYKEFILSSLSRGRLSLRLMCRRFTDNGMLFEMVEQ